MQKLLLLTTLWIGLLAAACSAAPDEPRSGTHQALDNAAAATDIATGAPCVTGCVSAVDYCDKHQSSELNCAEEGEKCLARCDGADGIATSPSVSAPASDDGIATSPSVSTQALNIGFGGGDISTGPGYQQCVPIQKCQFVCSEPQGPNDIYHCRLWCTSSC